MSQSTSSSTKVKLTGKEYSWDDVSHLNETQKAHRRGDIDVYAPIRHQKGDPSSLYCRTMERGLQEATCQKYS